MSLVSWIVDSALDWDLLKYCVAVCCTFYLFLIWLINFVTFSFSSEEISKSPDRDHLDIHQYRMYTNENLGTPYPALLDWTSLVLSAPYKKYHKAEYVQRRHFASLSFMLSLRLS